MYVDVTPYVHIIIELIYSCFNLEKKSQHTLSSAILHCPRNNSIDIKSYIFIEYASLGITVIMFVVQGALDEEMLGPFNIGVCRRSGVCWLYKHILKCDTFVLLGRKIIFNLLRYLPQCD